MTVLSVSVPSHLQEVLVVIGEYEGQRFCAGVFSSREKALDFMESKPNCSLSGPYNHIVDGRLEDIVPTPLLF